MIKKHFPTIGLLSISFFLIQTSEILAQDESKYSLEMTAREKAEADFDKVVQLCKQQKKNSMWEKYTPLAYAVKLGRYDVAIYFIDSGESVNTANPEVQVRIAAAGNKEGEQGKGQLKRIQEGATPLEIAVKQQDVEMLKILLSYNPENSANPDVHYKRYQQIGTAQPDGNILWIYTDSHQNLDARASSSILLDTLRLENQEIIDLIIGAYTDPERLYAEHSTVQTQQQPESMRSWIKQYFFLLNGVYEEIPDEVVDAFMNGMTNAIHDHNLLQVHNLLSFGWVPTKKDLEQACTENDFPIYELLLQFSSCLGEESSFLLPAKQNRADFIIPLLESGKVPTHEDLLTAINSGSLDVVKAFIQHGVPFNGLLSHELQKRQPAVFAYLASIADLDDVIALCQEPKNVGWRERKYTPMEYAIKIARKDAVQFFIENGEQITSSVLVDAMQLGKQEIIDLVIKACPDQKVLLATFSTTQALKQPEPMRSWIQQNHFLLKGVEEEITDDVVQAFMNGMSNAIRDHNALQVQQLLEYGWTPTKNDLEKACAENDLQIFKSLLQHVDMGAEGPFFYPAKYNRTNFIEHLIENGNVPTRQDLLTATNSGSLDVVKTLVQFGVPSKGLLSYDLQKKQPSVFAYLYSIADFYEVVELCRQQMGNNIPLCDRYPPIAYAVKLGRHDVVKFLIDRGESVNMATPDIPVKHTWEGGYNFNTYEVWIGPQNGSTPLEIAVSQQDVEMVKILTTYNLENRANPDIQFRRFDGVIANGDHYWQNGERYGRQPTNYSILLEALKHGNQEIIDFVIRAYTDSERLYAEGSAIQAKQQPESMRSWLEHTSFLRTGVKNEISDDIVNLFLKHRLEDAILENNFSYVEEFLRHGWKITKKEFEQALLKNDSQILDLLIHHDRVEENLLVIAVKFGSLDGAKACIQAGMAFEGMLKLAAQEQKKSLVEYFLTLSIDEQEIKDAYAIAYQVHAYEIMEILASKI